MIRKANALLTLMRTPIAPDDPGAICSIEMKPKPSVSTAFTRELICIASDCGDTKGADHTLYAA